MVVVYSVMSYTSPCTGRNSIAKFVETNVPTIKIVEESSGNEGLSNATSRLVVIIIVRLHSYGNWSEVMRISKSNDNNGILNGRDSYKKIWARSESTLRDCCYPILSVSNAFVRKSCGCGECSMFEIWSILGLLRIISGHWSEGMRISKSNDNNGIMNGRDSYKKIWARSESTLRDCYYQVLSVSNAFIGKSCSRGECSTFEIWSILGLLRIISGSWSEVMRIIKSNDNNGILKWRDSYKKIRSRTESPLRDCCYAVLSGSNNFSRKSCSRGACSTFEIWSILGLLRIILRCFSSFGLRKESLFVFFKAFKYV